MPVKLLLGILLLIVGLVVAVTGVISINQSDEVRDNPAVVGEQNAVVGDQNEPEREEAASMMLPVIAGLAIAAGAALIGIGMGNFSHPKIVPPNSPQAEKAATTRRLS
jgi:uncharacterized membrane protein YfcA